MTKKSLIYRSIYDYKHFIDRSTFSEINYLASRLIGERVAMVNSTPAGGGVAEILNSLVILMNSLGLEVDWHILKGTDNFFQTTKEFHNALQGDNIALTNKKKALYEQTCFNNALITHLDKYDLIVIHDPQPLALINYFKKRAPWIWRCHIDLSRPNNNLLKYLKPSIEQYDAMIVTSPKYYQPTLNIKQILITPLVDPLHDKNRPLAQKEIRTILRARGINTKKPIIAQVSRFDKWKDPIGVVKVFKQIRSSFNCQLILLGNLAIDDPEGPAIYRQVIKMTNNNPDIKVILNPANNDLTVNAIQSAAKVIIQKSIKEGFAITVAEAMWKGTPVVGSKVGGIPLQVVNGQTGYLVKNNSEAAQATLKLLHNAGLRNKLGRQAKERVRRHFLVTRSLLEYLRLFDFFLNKNHRFNIGFKYPYSNIINNEGKTYESRNSGFDRFADWQKNKRSGAGSLSKQ